MISGRIFIGRKECFEEEFLPNFRRDFIQRRPLIYLESLVSVD